MELIQYPQERCDPLLAGRILELERTAWPGDEEAETFPSAPDTYVTSFLWLEGAVPVCHVGARGSVLRHKGQTYAAYGLSEVVTHPAYRGRGLASEGIRRAARFIMERRADVSLFTCAPERVPFYTRVGWRAVEGACLVGGTARRPFRSDSLHLVTMMMFLSPRARLHQADFEHTDIVLELGENQLW